MGNAFYSDVLKWVVVLACCCEIKFVLAFQNGN